MAIALQHGDDLADLVDNLPVRPGPRAPLLAIDGAEITVLVGPFVPDADSVVLQIADVGIALKKPDQFVDDRFEVQPLGGDQRKAGGQVKPDLRPEQRQGAGAGAVILSGALVEHPVHQVQIGAHTGRLARFHRATEAPTPQQLWTPPLPVRTYFGWKSESWPKCSASR